MILLAQVESACPLCALPLVYKKRGKSYKRYELAHIYPLNPTEQEAAALGSAERLGEDPNDIDNLIPLCLNCHEQFDKPRTLPEYLALIDKKKTILAAQNARNLQVEYTLESHVLHVITALHSGIGQATDAELEFNPRDLTDKLGTAFDPLARRKIRRDVTEYFVFVREQFEHVERVNPGAFELISSQVRSFYLALRSKGLAQQAIYRMVVDWIERRTSSPSVEAAEIVTSYFIQNCEVL